MNEGAAAVIARLGLGPLPQEGGFFRRTWTSATLMAGGRAAGSAIYFLLTPADFSALHRLQTDERWLFHAGDPVEHVQLGGESSVPVRSLLGSDLAGGQCPQLVVPGRIWQGARLLADSPPGNPRTSPRHGWALLSCVMAPAWDEREFELGERAGLLRQFPAAVSWIEGFTR